MFGSTTAFVRLFFHAFSAETNNTHHCSRDSQSLYSKKNIKNGSHGTIQTFKNYFATVFLVFSFSKNKLYPNGSLLSIFLKKNKEVASMGWCRSSLCSTHIGIDDIEWKVERLSLDHEQPWIKLNQS